MLDPIGAVTDAFTSFLFGKVETTRLPVRTSTGQAQAVYLPTAAPGLGDSGVIIGREVYSGKGYIYDPFQLYGQQLPAPHWLVLGESGNGKSALEKTYVLRQLRFRDRQVVVLDAQGEDGVGEWNLIAEELGITPIRLDPMAALDGGIRLNPLDPAITTTGQLALLRTIIEVAMGHGLDERSGFALKVAHAYVNETIADRQPVLTDIVEQLRHPEPESAEAMNVDHRRRTRLGPGRRPGPGPAGRRRPARHVRRPDDGRHRPRRAADRLRPVPHRPQLDRHADPDGDRRRLAGAHLDPARPQEAHLPRRRGLAHHQLARSSPSSSSGC